MSWILSMDLSGARGSLSLFRRNGSELGFVEERFLPSAFQHSEELFTTLNELLQAHALTPADICAWYANQGPGSFTGLRIGLAAIKGICAATEAPIHMICGAQARALGWLTENVLPEGRTEILVESSASSSQFVIHSFAIENKELRNAHAEIAAELPRPTAQQILLVDRTETCGIYWPCSSRFLPHACSNGESEIPSEAKPLYWGAKEFVKAPLFATA